MASDFLHKFLGFIGMNDEDDYEPEEAREEEPKKTKEEIPVQAVKKPSKILNLHSNSSNAQSKVQVIYPVKYEECVKIGEYMKTRHQVVVNMQETDSEVAQKILDFISGCNFALDGSLRRIGKGIFLHVPYNMEISIDLERSLNNDKSFFNNVVGFAKER